MIAILLHGFTGDRTTWDQVCQHWQPELPVGGSLRPVDLPGHGEGPLVRDGWRANLDAVSELVGPQLQQAVVVGYSLGARVALGLLAEGMTQRAILIGVNPGLPETAQAERAERAARRTSDAAWAALLRADGLDAFSERWEAQPLFATQQGRGEPAALAARRALRRRQRAEQLARSLEHMGLGAMPDYRAALAAAADRATLVVGALDLKFRALAEVAARSAPALPLHVVEDAGHDVPLEQPRRLALLLARLCGAARPATAS